MTETYEEEEVVEAERESIEDYPKQLGEKGAGRKVTRFGKYGQNDAEAFQQDHRYGEIKGITKVL